MDVSIEIEVTRRVVMLPETGLVRDRITGQDYRLSEVDPRNPEMTLTRELTVTANVWWEHGGGSSRSGSWVCDDLAATFEGEEIWLTPSEEADAESKLRLAAEDASERFAEDLAAP
jgi:hypothetical protein